MQNLEEMDKKDDFKKTEYTTGFGKANLLSVLLIIPTLILFLLPFILIWNYETFKEGKNVFMDYLILMLTGGIILHELLHGISWAIFAVKGIRSIRFGIKWKYLTPYCHCKEPLKVNHYRIGAAMPLLILGVLPSIAGIISGNGVLLSFGLFFTWAAAGDIIILFMLKDTSKKSYILDHPTKLGFWVVLI